MWTGERKLVIKKDEKESDLLEIGVAYVRPDLHLTIFRESGDPKEGVVVEVAGTRTGPWRVVKDDTEEPFDLRHVRHPFLRLRAPKPSKGERVWSVVGGPE